MLSASAFPAFDREILDGREEPVRDTHGGLEAGLARCKFGEDVVKALVEKIGPLSRFGKDRQPYAEGEEDKPAAHQPAPPHIDQRSHHNGKADDGRLPERGAEQPNIKEIEKAEHYTGISDALVSAHWFR